MGPNCSKFSTAKMSLSTTEQDASESKSIQLDMMVVSFSSSIGSPSSVYLKVSAGTPWVFCGQDLVPSSVYLRGECGHSMGLLWPVPSP